MILDTLLFCYIDHFETLDLVLMLIVFECGMLHTYTC